MPIRKGTTLEVRVGSKAKADDNPQRANLNVGQFGSYPEYIQTLAKVRIVEFGRAVEPHFTDLQCIR